MWLTIKELCQHRKTIIHAAFQLFCAFRVESVPLLETAIKTGKSRNTIYRYYRRTERMVWEFLVKWWDIMIQIVQRIAEGVSIYAPVTDYG